jgi:predicted membrane protein
MTRSRLVFGLVFVALGVVLLLDQAGRISTWSVLARWWPVVLVLAGVAQLVTRPRNRVGGLVVGAIGGTLLLWTLGIVSTPALLWPVLLIGFGLWLLVRRPAGRDAAVTADDVVVVFGDREARVPAGPLTDRSVTAVFGDVDLDLTAATIEERARIRVTCVFADVDLVVPAGWNVTVSGPEILGGVKVRQASGPPADAPVLYLEIVLVLGDIEVRAA